MAQMFFFGLNEQHKNQSFSSASSLSLDK